MCLTIVYNSVASDRAWRCDTTSTDCIFEPWLLCAHGFEVGPPSIIDSESFIKAQFCSQLLMNQAAEIIRV